MNHDRASGSAFANAAAAELAIELVMPMIRAGLDTGRIGASGFLYIVIMDPALLPGDCSYEQAVLHEYAVGNCQEWDVDYARYAHEKARVCWRWQRSGHQLRACSPHVLRPADAGVWGGVWLDGITVGVSGADPWFDEAVGLSVAAFLRAIAKQHALQLPETLTLTGEQPLP